MSRSRKKVPVVKDNDGPGRKKKYKKISNRRFRRTPIQEDEVCILDSRQYKKVDSWDIVDYSVYWDDRYKDVLIEKYKFLMK